MSNSDDNGWQFEESSELDRLFLGIVSDLVNLVQSTMTHEVQQIIAISSGFLSENAHAAMKDFYNLYFAKGSLEADKEKMNREVDDIFDQVQASLTSGGDGAGVKDLESSRNLRVTLAGVQKNLETIISLDKGIKERLLPVVTSMQFEDMITQRLNHIRDVWAKAIEVPNGGQPETYKLVARHIARILTSQKERELYFPLLLNEPSPEGAQEENLGDFLML